MSIFAGLATFTKISGLLTVLIILIAFIVLFLSKKISKINVLKKILIFSIIVIISGGWYKIFKNLVINEIQQISAEPYKFFGEVTRDPPHFLDIKLRLFDSVWTNLGWGASNVVTVDGFFVFISVTILISISGIIFIFIKRRKLFSKQIAKTDLVMMLVIVTTFFSGLVYTVLIYNASNGRNVLITLPFIAIGIIIGFNGLLNGKKPTVLILLIIIFLFYSVMHIQVIDEDLRYDFGNKYSYQNILKGSGTGQMGGQFLSIQHGIMENEKEGIYFFMHPVDGEAKWSYHQDITDENSILKFYYGFTEGPIRTTPVQFEIFVNEKGCFPG